MSETEKIKDEEGDFPKENDNTDVSDQCDIDDEGPCPWKITITLYVVLFVGIVMLIVAGVCGWLG